MDGPEFIVIIVAIVCTTGLIKSWINRNYNKNGVDEDTFDRLARAFMQHKKEMQERIQNLEAIIAGEDEDDDFNQIEAPNNKSKLSNDLHQKDKVQS